MMERVETVTETAEKGNRRRETSMDVSEDRSTKQETSAPKSSQKNDVQKDESGNIVGIIEAIVSDKIDKSDFDCDMSSDSDSLVESDDENKNIDILIQALQEVREGQKKVPESSPAVATAAAEENTEVEEVVKEPASKRLCIQDFSGFPEDEASKCYAYKALQSNLEYQQALKNAQITITKNIAKLTQMEKEVEDEVKRELAEIGEVHAVSDSIRFYGSPYFKTYSYFPCPANEDTIKRLKNNELDIALMAAPVKWQRWEMRLLESAVRKTALNKLQAPLIAKKKRLFEQLKAEEAGNLSSKKTRRLIEQVIVEISSQAGDPLFQLLSDPKSDIDWMTISAKELDGRRLPEECQAMWNTCLAPGLCRGEWTDDETNELHRIAKEMGYNDWEAIANKLDSGRSAYQCFVHMQSILNKLRKCWTRAEDKQLLRCVQMLRNGRFIPFKKIACMLPGRTPLQCKQRWVLLLNPSLSFYSFSSREDKLIIEAREKHKMSFSQLAAVFPGRTVVQLRNRYSTLTQTSMPDITWTSIEDKKLLGLVAEQKTKGTVSFALLAQRFPNRTRLELKNRYNILKKNTTNEKKTSNSESSTNTNTQAIKRQKAPSPVLMPPPARTSKDVTSFINRIENRSSLGRKQKQRDLIDKEIAQMFRSHYHQLKGRRKKKYDNEEIQKMAKVDLELCNILHTSFDWSKETELVKCPIDTDNLLSMYRQLRAANKATPQEVPVPGTMLKTLIPPNVTTLIGMRTLLLEQRGILSMSLQQPTAMLRNMAMQAAGMTSVNESPTTSADTFPSANTQSNEIDTSYDMSAQNNFALNTPPSSISDTVSISPGTPKDCAPVLNVVTVSNVNFKESSKIDGNDYKYNKSDVDVKLLEKNKVNEMKECTKESLLPPKQGHVDTETVKENLTEDSSNEPLLTPKKEYIDPETAKSLFLQRFLSLFCWPALMTQIGPSFQSYDDFFSQRRLTCVSDYEVNEESDADSAGPATALSDDSQQETPEVKKPKLSKFQRKRALRDRWATYRKEKEEAMKKDGLTEEVLQQQEEEESQAKLQHEKDEEYVRIPGKRGRPARKRRHRRRLNDK